jgi:hypothetical protein
MPGAKVMICADEATAKTLVTFLKKSGGGGYKNVDGPFKVDAVIVETFGIPGGSTYEFSDTSDAETWFVVGRP